MFWAHMSISFITQVKIIVLVKWSYEQGLAGLPWARRAHLKARSYTEPT